MTPIQKGRSRLSLTSSLRDEGNEEDYDGDKNDSLILLFLPLLLVGVGTRVRLAVLLCANLLAAWGGPVRPWEWTSNLGSTVRLNGGSPSFRAFHHGRLASRLFGAPGTAGMGCQHALRGVWDLRGSEAFRAMHRLDFRACSRLGASNYGGGRQESSWGLREAVREG
eukprot:3128701-Pyramimonas_sp.AAC.1